MRGSARPMKSVGTYQTPPRSTGGEPQRLEPPRHRHDAVSRRQHHHRRSPHERQPAGLPVVAHAQAEGAQELGQRDHGAAADVDRGQGAPAVARDDRQTVRGGLTAAGEGGGEHDAQRPADAARTSRPDARPSLDRGQGAWRRGAWFGGVRIAGRPRSFRHHSVRTGRIRPSRRSRLGTSRRGLRRGTRGLRQDWSGAGSLRPGRCRLPAGLVGRQSGRGRRIPGRESAPQEFLAAT